MLTNEYTNQPEWPEALNEVPKEIFHREDVYRAELERIFRGDEWFPLAHMAEVPSPGDFKTGYIGESPVLVVHGDDGVVRVFDNTCPHRGTQLTTACRGRGEEIECPYHRWRFNNNGELIGCPGRSGFPPDFKDEDYGLIELRSAIAHGLVFATYGATAPDLDSYLGDIKPQLAKALDADGELELLGYQKVSFASNWKAYCDNEGYHAPLLHSAFVMLRWKGGEGSQIMTDQAHKAINTDLTVPEPGFLNDHTLIEARDSRVEPRSVIINLFPLNIIVNVLDIINVRYAFPRSVDETEVHYAYFSRRTDDEELRRHRIRQAANLMGPSGLISLEDGAVFNRVHVGSHTPGSVAFQKGVSDDGGIPDIFHPNDEAGNLVRWERYRQIMGFER